MANSARRALKSIWQLLKLSAGQWSDDNALTLSGSLAFSAMFSIAPLLIITIGIVGYIFGDQNTTVAVNHSLTSLVGPDGTKAIESLIHAASAKPRSGLIATVVGLITLFIGASSAFQQLQGSLDSIWKVRSRSGSGVKYYLRQRLWSFSMVAVIALLLLVSLALSAALSGVGAFVGDSLPGGAVLWQVVNEAVSMGVITLLFACVFKILPDVELEWNDVWVGALATALLFTLGKALIGLYLARSSVASAYGAAGSLIVVLLWVYYSSAILFFGAELTRATVLQKDRAISPSEGAEWFPAQTVAAASSQAASPLPASPIPARLSAKAPSTVARPSKSYGH